ncbi:solute carrier family 28 member 3-like isoform X1 [Hydra vulgaris]|uniref:Sodium/nucleoside cotransporter n=1 Tax=Hydra vulgaris TaxID=6087 RepID=A0ABM4BIW6_HYDVU
MASRTGTKKHRNKNSLHTFELDSLSPKSSHESKSQDKIKSLTKKTLRGPLAPINNICNAVENKIKNFCKKHTILIQQILLVLSLTAYIVYFIVALIKNPNKVTDLIYISAFFFVCLIYWIFKKLFGRKISSSILKPMHNAIVPQWKYIKWISITAFLGFVIFWISWDTAKQPERLISLAGLIVYLLIGFLFSKHRDQIKWRPVFWGLSLQFLFGLFILRTSVGYFIFKWLGDRVSIFLNFSRAGSEFLFSKEHMEKHFFVFVVLPVVVYFSAITYVLYYLEWIQIVIKKIAWVLQISMGTSPAESVNAAGNIFLGQTEAPLLIRPFLENMTESELHCVMTGGFATIAGSVLGAYISFGIPASHLLSASVMSAPAAISMAKLLYPEVEECYWKNADEVEIEQTNEHNLFEAIATGASMSIGLVANISVMLIAFLSLLRFVNALLGWLGSNVDVQDFSFEFICSYIFMPFAYIMGVSWNDSFAVAKLLGIKTFLNEFIAYQQLSTLISNRILNASAEKLSQRSEVIATYALCGFANFGSMGIQLGGLSCLIPSKKQCLAKLVFRALVSGTLACFMTACIAGMLYDDQKYDSNITPTSARNLTINIFNISQSL